MNIQYGDGGIILYDKDNNKNCINCKYYYKTFIFKKDKCKLHRYIGNIPNPLNYSCDFFEKQ